MKNKLSIIIFTLFLMLSYGSVEQVLACSCFEQKPVCEAFGEAKAVFVGEVIDGESPEKMSDLVRLGSGKRPFILKVKEAFLGTKVDKEIVLYTGSGFGDCGFPFEKGETYLIYAYEEDGIIQTNICTRSAHISNVGEEDFEYLKSLKKRPSGARLFGKVELYAKSSFEENSIQPMKNLRLLVEQTNDRRKRYQLYTDKKGEYEIVGLPAGKYRLKPFFPKYLESDELDLEDFIEFELNDKGCYKQDFLAENNSSVSLKVVDSNGNPVKNILVEFVPIYIKKSPENLYDVKEFGVTNPQGGLYKFNLPPANYTISVNYFHAPNKKYPFPTTFYPNTNDRTKAEVIEIKRGTVIKDLVIQLPAQLEKEEVIGSVYWEDGSPAANISVCLEDNIDKRFCIDGWTNKTDENGNFVLQGYKNQTYRVKAQLERSETGKEFMDIFKAQSEPFILRDKVSVNKLILVKENFK